MASISKSAKRTGLVTVSRCCPERAYVQIQVPSDMNLIDRIVLKTLSNDQGFSGTAMHQGTYDYTYSWFELAVIDSNGHDRFPRYQFQSNRHAIAQPARHTNTWDRRRSDAQIQELMNLILPGDWILVIPRARFPSWRNYVHEAEIELIGAAVPEHMISGFTQELYQACPLSKPAEDIRIICIEPGGLNDPLTCKITRRSILSPDASPYEALSYHWGNAGGKRPIDVTLADDNGDEKVFRLPIRENLHNALRHLRPANGPPRALWADAICINQSNAREQTEQVGVMRHIYRNATGVVIWLGASSPEIEQCVEQAKQISTRYAAHQFEQAETYSQETAKTHEQLHEGLYDPQAPHNWAFATCPLLNFPWYHRAWVVQEVFNAKIATVQCGELIVPWPLILRMNKCMNESSAGDAALPKPIMPALMSELFDLEQYRLDPFGTQHKHPTRSKLMNSLDVLVEGLDFDATLPRDKVFALLGFGEDVVSSSSKNKELIRPDYGSKSNAEVFRDFTRWWIMNNQSLRILSSIHVSVGRTWQTILELPDVSWGRNKDRPSWSFWYEGKSSWAKATLGLRENCPWTASKNSIPCQEAIQQASDQSVLSLKGCRISTIKNIHPFPYWAPNAELGELRNVYDVLLQPLNQWRTWTSTAHQAGEARQWAAWQDAERIASHKGDHILAHLDYARRTGGVECHPKTFFVLQDGSRGLCPPMACIGDVVVVLFGGSVPYVLREVVAGNASDDYNHTYELVGECYLEGYMEGLVIDQLEQSGSNRVAETFCLV